jgi:hypothetical protein
MNGYSQATTAEEYWEEIQENNTYLKDNIYELLKNSYRLRTYNMEGAGFSSELTGERYSYFMIGNLQESSKQFTKDEIINILDTVFPYISEFDEMYEYIIILEGVDSSKDMLGYFYINDRMDIIFFETMDGFYSGRSKK